MALSLVTRQSHPSGETERNLLLNGCFRIPLSPPSDVTLLRRTPKQSKLENAASAGKAKPGFAPLWVGVLRLPTYRTNRKRRDSENWLTNYPCLAALAGLTDIDSRPLDFRGALRRYSSHPCSQRASTGDACWRSGSGACGFGFVSRTSEGLGSTGRPALWGRRCGLAERMNARRKPAGSGSSKGFCRL